MNLIISIISLLLGLRFALSSKDHLAVFIRVLSIISVSTIVYFFGIILGLESWMIQSLILVGLIITNIKIPFSKLNWNINLANNNIRTADISTLSILIIGFLLFNRYSHPFGGWDAQAIWSLRASYLMDSSNWTNGFSALLTETHPDYPLFVPLSIVSIAHGFSLDISQASSIFHVGIFILLIGLLYSSLRKYNNGWIATLSILLICLNRSIIAKAASQYADTSLALFILACTVLAFQNKNKNLILTGILCASMAWTKNEGMIPAFFFISYFVNSNRKSYSDLSKLLLGIVIIVLPYLYFKIAIAPDNVMFAQETISSRFYQLLKMDRYWIILQSLIKNIGIYFTPMIPLLITSFILLRKYKLRKETILFIILTATFVLYSASYLITPYDIEWHIQHSYDRLMYQLYPALIYLSMITLSHSKLFTSVLTRFPK